MSVHGAFATSAHRRGDELGVGPGNFKENRVVFDELSLILVIAAVLLNIQAATYYQQMPELVNLINIIQMLLVGSVIGILLLYALGQAELRWDFFLSGRDLGYTLAASLAGFVLALLLWNVVIAPATSSVFDMVRQLTVFNQRVFLSKVAVAEELLMMGMFFPYFAPRLKWGAYPAVCIAFAVLHFAVYGTQPSALWAVGMYRAVFLFQWYATGCRISVPMLTHVMINLAAAG